MAPINQKPNKQETKTNVMNDADALIGSLIIPPIGSGSLNPSAASALIAAQTKRTYERARQLQRRSNRPGDCH